jgi:hypothetical protein
MSNWELRATVITKIDTALSGPSVESLEGPSSALSFFNIFYPMVAIFLRLLAFAVFIYFIRSGLRDRFEQSIEIEAPEKSTQAEPKNTQF